MNIFRSVALAFTISLLTGNMMGQEQLSEVERLRFELAKTQSQLHAALAERDLCRAELTPVRGEWVKATLVKLAADIEAAHPGFTFDVMKGVLLPKPPAPEAGKKP